jgi:hypothetical protein
LEDEFDHPDNRGWMNLFKHWSWAPIVRVAWTICAGNYGARFQSFCERHLDLYIGETKAREVDLGREIDFSGPSETFDWSTEIDKEAAEIAKGMWTWLRELPVGSNVIADALLKVIEKAPNSERDPEINEEEALAEAKKSNRRFVNRKKRSTIPLRASDRPDEEWYAAATLLEACRRKNVPEDLKLTWANDVAELVLSHGAITADRILLRIFKTSSIRLSVNWSDCSFYSIPGSPPQLGCFDLK